MTRKGIAVVFLILFAWNAVFGGVGGLVLCLHKNLTIHPELVADNRFDCDSDQVNGNFVSNCLSESESCVDVEIDAVNLPQARSTEVQSITVSIAHHSVIPEVIEPDFTLRELAHVVQGQAPPELVDTSVLVAQTVNLRL